MSEKTDHLAKLRMAFEKRWQPNEDEPLYYYGDDFKIDLDRLIYAAFAAAQEPFVFELQSFRDSTLKTGLLDPTTWKVK